MPSKSPFSIWRLTYVTISALAAIMAVWALLSVAGTAQGAADFSIQDEDIVLDTLTPEQDSLVKITVTVHNEGPDLGNVTVTVNVDGKQLNQTTLDNLAAGDEGTLTVDWPLDADAKLGLQKIEVKLSSPDDNRKVNDMADYDAYVYQPFDDDKLDLLVKTEDSYATYIHDGHIRIDGPNAKLSLAGGDFEIQQDYANQYYISLLDGGILELADNATLRSNKPLTIYMADDSKIIVSEDSLLKVDRIVAVGDGWLSLTDSRLTGDLYAALASFDLAGATLTGGTKNKAIVSAMASTIVDSTLTYESLKMEVSDNLVVTRSHFNIEDSLQVRPGSSVMTDSRFSLSLTHFVTGNHKLTNVTTSNVKAGGDAVVERWWYLTLAAVDLGGTPLPNASVTYRHTGQTDELDRLTDEKGLVKLTLLTNETTAAGDDFSGNYEVRAAFEGASTSWLPLTLQANDVFEIMILDPAIRQNTNVKIEVGLFDKNGRSISAKEIEGGDEFKVRIKISYKDQSGDPVANLPVTVTISGDNGKKDGETDGDGLLEVSFKAPDEGGVFTIQASAAGNSGSAKLRVAEGDDSLGNWALAVILIILVVAFGLLVVVFQRVTENYPTEVAQCGSCGQQIPLDSTSCPECGEKLDPYEVFDPTDSSWVSRKEEE